MKGSSENRPSIPPEGARPPERKGFAALAAALFLPLALAFALRLPFLSASPLQHDTALMMAKAQELALGKGEIPFGETPVYRPVILLAVTGMLKILPGPVTPHAALLAAALVSLLLTGLTAGLAAAWLWKRFSFSLPAALSAAAAWLLLPSVLPFMAEGLQTTPALFFALVSFLFVDAAAARAGKPGARWLAFAPGPFLVLMFFSRDTFALFSLVCALRILQAKKDRFPLLGITFFSGLLFLGAWALLEVLVLHPGHSLLALLPTHDLGLNLNPRLLLEGRQWDRVGWLAVLGFGVVWAVLAPLGILKRGEGPPRLPLAAWAAVFLLLQLSFFRPGLRYFAPPSLAVLLLSLRLFPASKRPGLCSLLFLGAGALGAVLSLPVLFAVHRLPQAGEVRARAIFAKAGPSDQVLFLGMDYAFGKWLRPGKDFLVLWSLLPPKRRDYLARKGRFLAYSRPARLGDLLEEVFLQARQWGGNREWRVVSAGDEGLRPALKRLEKKGFKVEILGEIPPGASRSQGDPLAQDLGWESPVSTRKEIVFRISWRGEGGKEKKSPGKRGSGR